MLGKLKRFVIEKIPYRLYAPVLNGLLRLNAVRYRGDEYACPFCGGKFARMMPTGLDLPVNKERQIIGSGYGAMMNAIQGNQFVPPPPNNYMAQVGSNFVEPPDPSKAQDSAAPWIQAGGTAAAGLLLLSDRNQKHEDGDTDEAAVMDRLRDLPIKEWRWRDANKFGSGKHIGPMAQDFWAQFRLGDHETAIPVTDALGVLMAAVKDIDRRLLAIEG